MKLIDESGADHQLLIRTSQSVEAGLCSLVLGRDALADFQPARLRLDFRSNRIEGYC
jgi:hypothetical protein